MEREMIEVVRDRFSLADKNKYFIQGYLPKECRLEVYLDQKRQDNFVLTKEKNLSTVEIELPENLGAYKKILVFICKDGKRYRWFSGKAADIQRKKNMPQYYIDYSDIDFQKKICVVSGWAVYHSPLNIYVTDSRGNKLECKIEQVNRRDVQEQFHEWDVGKFTGFLAEIPFEQEKSIRIVFEGGKCRTIRNISLQKSKIAGGQVRGYYNKGLQYIRTYGIAGFMKKLVKKIEAQKNRPDSYEKWLAQNQLSEAELDAQRRKRFSYAPLISIVIPLYNTPISYLDELLASIIGQTYGNFQLCLADGSDNEKIEEFIKKSYGKESRIRYKRLEKNDGISENTNRAIEMASGDFIMFSDHDDTLAPNALFEIVNTINENPGTDVVYTDEDKVTMDGGHYYEPHFKPDFNLDMLRSNNYICHIFTVKREIVNKAGMLRKEYDGAQDYDFILRCCEQAKNIQHVPKILYHWRNHPASTAGNPESKMYAFEAGRKALEAHYERMGIQAEVEMTPLLGRYRTRYAISGHPVVSIIIPNKDHIEDLDKCLKSIYEKTTYDNYEIILVENNSEKKETFAYYEKVKERYGNIQVLTWKREFNYAAINNFAVTYAKGEYLLFLNNDVELISEKWIEEMLGICQREDVGAVGTKLYYPDDTVQHAGVVIGLGGVAGHIFCGFAREEYGYFARLVSVQDYSAVTAACMMTKRKLFQNLEGFDEGFQVAFNDVDYCMKVRQAEKLVVFTPYAELYHYESKSRGREETEAQKKRFAGEVQRFEEKWPDILEKGDPFYNKNLTLKRGDCSLRKRNE